MGHLSLAQFSNSKCLLYLTRHSSGAVRCCSQSLLPLEQWDTILSLTASSSSWSLSYKTCYLVWCVLTCLCAGTKLDLLLPFITGYFKPCLINSQSFNTQWTALGRGQLFSMTARKDSPLISLCSCPSGHRPTGRRSCRPKHSSTWVSWSSRQRSGARSVTRSSASWTVWNRWEAGKGAFVFCCCHSSSPETHRKAQWVKIKNKKLAHQEGHNFVFYNFSEFITLSDHLYQSSTSAMQYHHHFNLAKIQLEIGQGWNAKMFFKTVLVKNLGLLIIQWG